MCLKHFWSLELLLGIVAGTSIGLNSAIVKTFSALFFHFPFPKCISLFFQLYLGTQLKHGKIGAKVANYIIIRVQSNLENQGGEKKKHLICSN